MTESEAKANIVTYAIAEAENLSTEIGKAFDVAIQAVKKQMPKKPYYEGDGYADGELVYDQAKCPVCGHEFEYGINDWGCNYCSDCGQRLDWGDNEE